MDNADPVSLTIDPEFSTLIAPLHESEYQYLEESILRDGCLDPIVVWNNIIVDGHNRYEICTRWNIAFRTEERAFTNREEVISWICSIQLGRRNISEEIRKYLIGKRFDAEKIVGRRAAQTNGTFRALPTVPVIHDRTTVSSNHEEAPKPPKNVTAERIGRDYQLSHSTIEKYAIYSRALDEIGSKSPTMLPKILSGKYKISHDNVVMLSRLGTDDVKKLESRLSARKDRTAFIPLSVSREQINDCITKNCMPRLRPEIKNIPAYDPDAEINGLALTVPAWISSIARTRDTINVENTTLDARQKLESVLQDLMESISSILAIIRRDDRDQ